MKAAVFKIKLSSSALLLFAFFLAFIGLSHCCAFQAGAAKEGSSSSLLSRVVFPTTAGSRKMKMAGGKMEDCFENERSDIFQSFRAGAAKPPPPPTRNQGVTVRATAPPPLPILTDGRHSHIPPTPTNPENIEARKSEKEKEKVQCTPGENPSLKIHCHTLQWHLAFFFFTFFSLSLFLSYPLSDVALLVALDGAVYEEYLISTLQFSWPQVSCLSSPTRGSRIVFATHRDRLGQSFNVKLTGVLIMATVAGPEVCIEESLKNSGNNVGLEVACQSDHVTSGRSIYRYVALGSSNPFRNNSNMGLLSLPLLNLCSRGIMAGHNAEDTLAFLPSSSTSCFSESSTETRKDVLYHIEKVIVELGGDLSI